jgi:UTP--glucose-1-phosphate uridylyltransferase
MIPPVTKAVFPAAGLGTGFLPATKAQPMEMLPLVDTPLIQYAVEEVAQAGIRDICVVTGRGKSAIEDHFDVSFELEHLLESRHKDALLKIVRRISDLIDVTYVRQKEALGLGHAVLRARNEVGDRPFAVLLADDVIQSDTPCIRQLLDVYEATGDPVIALMRVPLTEISEYGAVRAETASVVPGHEVYRIQELVEKPEPGAAPSDLAIMGRYILTPDIFDILETASPGRGGEIQLTDAIRELSTRRTIYGVCFRGRRYDAGSKLGFLQATVEFALRRDDMGPAFRRYLKELIAGL